MFLSRYRISFLLILFQYCYINNLSELEHFHDGSTIIGDASRSDLSLHLPRARSRKHNAMDTSNPSEMMPPPPVPELPPVAAPVTAEQPRSPQPEPVVDPMFPVPEPEPVLAEITEPLLPPEPATPQLAETSAAPEEQAGPTEKELEMNDDIFMDNLPALNISNEHGLHTTHTEKVSLNSYHIMMYACHSRGKKIFKFSLVPRAS